MVSYIRSNFKPDNVRFFVRLIKFKIQRMNMIRLIFFFKDLKIQSVITNPMQKSAVSIAFRCFKFIVYNLNNKLPNIQRVHSFEKTNNAVRK